MTPAEKILILLSLCDGWTWTRPSKELLSSQQELGGRPKLAAIVRLWHGEKFAKFVYRRGVSDLWKYRLCLEAVNRIGVHLPDFGYDDLESLAMA